VREQIHAIEQERLRKLAVSDSTEERENRKATLATQAAVCR
jgi:hypothetical protein